MFVVMWLTSSACGSDETAGPAAAGPTDGGTRDVGTSPENDAAGDSATPVGDAATEDAPGLSCDAAKGLVGWWSFDEGTGTTSADKSASNNPGTLTGGPTWSTDTAPIKVPNTTNAHALAFDGVDTHVEVGNGAALRLTGPLSIVAWFKTTATLANYRTLVSKWWSDGLDAAYALSFSNNGILGFSLNNSAKVGLSATTVAGLVLNDGSWHVAVGTWDGTTARIYVDGVQRGSAAAPAGFGALADITYPVRIGTDARYAPSTGDRYFEGLIDDVRIYGRALEPQEVGLLFDGACVIR